MSNYISGSIPEWYLYDYSCRYAGSYEMSVSRTDNGNGNYVMIVFKPVVYTPGGDVTGWYPYHHQNDISGITISDNQYKPLRGLAGKFGYDWNSGDPNPATHWPGTSYRIAELGSDTPTQGVAYYSNNQLYWYVQVPDSAGTVSGAINIQNWFNSNCVGVSSNINWSLDYPSKNSYTITYNANGGTGAPAAQTKLYNQSITLSSGTPTRSGYIFKGWAVSQAAANAKTVSYQPGATYNINANLTLFAVWNNVSDFTASTIILDLNETGSTTSIGFTNIGSGYVYSLELYKNGVASPLATLQNKQASTTVAFNPTNSPLWQYMGSSVSNNTDFYLKLTTIISSTSAVVGSVDKYVTVSVNNAVVPVIDSWSRTPVQDSAISSNPNYIKGLSGLKIHVEASIRNYATPRTLQLAIDGSLYSASFALKSGSTTVYEAEITTNTFVTSGSFNVMPVVVDSRGRSASATAAISVLNWMRPQLSNVDIIVGASTVTIRVYGKVASVANPGSTPAEMYNSAWLKLEAKKEDGSPSESGWNQKWPATGETSVKNDMVYETSEKVYALLHNTIDNNNYYDIVLQKASLQDFDTVTYSFKVYFGDLAFNNWSGIFSIYEKKAGRICISRKAGGKGVAFFQEAVRDGVDVNGLVYSSDGFIGNLTGNVTGNCSGSSGSCTGNAATATKADKVKAQYTGNGGQQNPNYFGVNTVGHLMMNTSVNGNTQYKNWIISDPYAGNDVSGATAIGINRQSLGAYIMGSDAARTSWSRSAELLGTHNTKDYVVDQGTSNGWTYRKWKSGLIEAWCFATPTITSWSAWGGIYESNWLQVPTYPAITINNKCISVGLLPWNNNYGMLNSVEIYKENNIVYYYFLRGAAGSGSTQVNVCLYLRGTT